MNMHLNPQSLSEGSVTSSVIPHHLDPALGGISEPICRAIGSATAAAAPFVAPRVLVVEDNLVNQKIARQILQKWGFHVDVACNGVVALAVLERAAREHVPYDLALMDCQMPEMNGFDTTRAIRRREADHGGPSRRLPVIALTASVLEGDREACHEAGMDDFLAKPYRAADLREIVTRWLSDPRCAGNLPQ
jgi:CheY-like chemotaxis protein